MLFTPLTRLVSFGGVLCPGCVGPSDISDMTDNTMALIRRTVKRVKRCPWRWRRWMVATSDTETLSLSYRISCASCGTARQCPDSGSHCSTHSLAASPRVLWQSSSLFLSPFADLRSDFDRLDLNRLIALDRYVGVGDRSYARRARLDCCAKDQLPFFTLERISGIL